MSQTQPGGDPRIPDHTGHPVMWVIVLAILTAVIAAIVLTVSGDTRADQRQNALQPFYTPPSPLPVGSPGDVIRTEPLGITVPGGSALRILYRSQDAAGNATVSSGMVFIPKSPAATDGRPVVAWAHGTVGLAPQCAPSRIAEPVRNLPWVAEMLARGWVVTATDYAGLGTPGTSGYLISGDEGRDVINAVRAARNIPGADASHRWVSWGHSQGGHAALAAGNLAAAYAPELRLVAIATAAPAADLRALLALQWNQAVSWVIGSDVVGTWPATYPELQRDPILTANGKNHWQEVLGKCIKGSAITAKVRQDMLGQNFFNGNPSRSAPWQRRFIQNTPRPTPRDVPLFIAQSTADEVVLPRTTATVIRRWCTAGVNIGTLWIDQVPHNDTAMVVGPSVVQWIEGRLSGAPAPNDCSMPTPVPPLAG